MVWTKRAAALIVAGLSLVGPALPAKATVDANVVAAGFAGHGTSLPGIPGPMGASVTGDVVKFAGPAVVSFVGSGTDAATCTLSFSGTADESTLTGSGTGTATCKGVGVVGVSLDETCTVNFLRVISDVVLTGDCTGTAFGLLAGAVQLVPLNVSPTTNYELVGAAGAVGIVVS